VLARLYRPSDVETPPGLVLIHGVHHLGIEEPRLQHFARTLASAGVAVCTPQVNELADYRIDARSIETIGRAAHAFATQLKAQRVGLMGLSFAGGLSLVAAADQRFQGDVGYVVAVGAHDDLGRVSRFLVVDQVERPDGSKAPLKAHEYGSLVLAYGHAEELFSGADLEPAREAMRAWLWDDKVLARRTAATMNGEAAQRLEWLFTHELLPLRGELLGCIERSADAIAAVSPSAHMSTLKVPVLALHGAGDTVIPAAETEWLARDVPPGLLRAALVSKALQHVELEGKPSVGEQLELVHFMALVLEEADTVAP
jgi:dienelactone hydrolase